jgi:hypothetical protein
MSRIIWTPKENDMELSTILIRTGACLDARIWAKTQPDLETAWRECKRSDWMLWLLAWTTLNQDDSRLRLMACDFAEAVLIYVPACEDRPRRAIECARRFAAGDATRAEMDAAGAAAGDAARAAGAAARAAGAAAGAAARDAALAAWAAAGAAGDAAWAAGDAAWAAWAAAWAAWAAAGAAAGDAWDAARAAQSDIIRRYFPECPEIKPKLPHKAV